MLYLIDVHWTRRVPTTRPGLRNTGWLTVAVNGVRSLGAAEKKATRIFTRKHGRQLDIHHCTEKADPAGIFKP